MSELSAAARGRAGDAHTGPLSTDLLAYAQAIAPLVARGVTCKSLALPSRLPRPV